MDKLTSLENIKEAWTKTDISLADKVSTISNNFYSVGLDLASTAEYIKATPAELDAILSLGGLSEEILERLSKINPPETTWELFANASEDEINQALDALEQKTVDDSHLSEFVFRHMSEVAGPTVNQRVGMLTSSDIRKARIKGEEFKVLSQKEITFMKRIASQRYSKELTDPQIEWFKDILIRLVEKGAIKRDSIDGDVEFCDRVMDALGK